MERRQKLFFFTMGVFLAFEDRVHCNVYWRSFFWLRKSYEVGDFSLSVQ